MEHALSVAIRATLEILPSAGIRLQALPFVRSELSQVVLFVGIDSAFLDDAAAVRQLACLCQAPFFAELRNFDYIDRAPD